MSKKIFFFLGKTSLNLAQMLVTSCSLL